jgi:hypothetical protein
MGFDHVEGAFLNPARQLFLFLRKIQFGLVKTAKLASIIG